MSVISALEFVLHYKLYVTILWAIDLYDYVNSCPNEVYVSVKMPALLFRQEV